MFRQLYFKNTIAYKPNANVAAQIQIATSQFPKYQTIAVSEPQMSNTNEESSINAIWNPFILNQGLFQSKS